MVAAAVNDSSDIVRDPHFLERTLVDLAGTALGDAVRMPGPILHMRGSERPTYDGVPAVGEHTYQVLGDLDGVSSTDLVALAEQGIISSHGR